jgi:hypothetical protein
MLLMSWEGVPAKDGWMQDRIDYVFWSNFQESLEVIWFPSTIPDEADLFSIYQRVTYLIPDECFYEGPTCLFLDFNYSWSNWLGADRGNGAIVK